MAATDEHFEKKAVEYATTNFVQLRDDMPAEQALTLIRNRPRGSQALIYFYVVDENQKLIGVLQTRALLTAQPDEILRTIMIPRVIAIPETATVLEACEFFVLYKFLAFPVVDPARRIRGVVDINLFHEEVFGFKDSEDTDDVFQAIGFHIEQVRNASPLRALRYRLPWLLVTILAGTICAFVARAHEHTIAQSVVVALFLTLVLALGESVTVQSMTLVLEALHAREPNRQWFFSAARRELMTALPLAASCGVVVFLVVWLVGRIPWPAFVISASVSMSVIVACLLGLCIPTLLHAAKLDPKIAAGPITLALTDVATLLVYFSLASAWL